jgi:hypothetical protein
MSDQYCTINPNGGKLKVQLIVNNALLASGGFIIFDENGKEIEKWKMKVKSNGMDEYDIVKPTESLKGKTLKWAVNVCSGNSAIDTGIVDIKILQDNELCQLTNPLNYPLDNIPTYESGNAVNIKRGIIFNFKTT